MQKPVYVLNGPNLNRLGTREPHIYGHTTLAEIEQMCGDAAPGLPVEFRQTNHEGTLIDWIQEAADQACAIVINPAAWSFTSVALLDALKMFPGPIIEVHISNIYRREQHYQHSFVSLAATAVIAGLGADGYPTAIRAVATRLKTPK